MTITDLDLNLVAAWQDAYEASVHCLWRVHTAGGGVIALCGHCLQDEPSQLVADLERLDPHEHPPGGCESPGHPTEQL